MRLAICMGIKMKIVTGMTEFELNRDTAVAIGKFDGLHLGHSKLIEEIIEKKQEGLAACVFTFEPSPTVFFGLSDGKELTTKEEKRYILERMGVDILVEFPMTKETASISPEVFVKEILVNKMHTKWIVAGTDVSFGDKGKGNAQLLYRMAKECGYQVKLIEKIKLDGTEISSTLVRSQVEQGNMSYAAELLGRPYTIRGTVVHGKALGRKMGMPTVNLLAPNNKLLPPCGVYFSAVFFDGKKYSSISNIGYKPTVTDERVLGIETYLYDFAEEIYEEEIEVCLYEFKSAEQRFSSIEELKKQVTDDITHGKDYHLSKNG